MIFRHEASRNVHGFRTTTPTGSGAFLGQFPASDSRSSFNDNVLIVFQSFNGGRKSPVEVGTAHSNRGGDDEMGWMAQ